MLTNYDAKSVAEVMGIAFLHGLDAEGVSKTVDEDFVIRVDDTRVMVVETRTSDAVSQFRPSNGRPGWNHVASELVSSPSSTLIEKAVERGLPRQALRHVAEWLAGGDKAKASLLEWGVVPKTTLDRREIRLSPQESERTERVARLFVHARRALGTEAEARAFMTTAHPLLDDRSPVDVARTDLGARRIEQILNGLEYGLAL